MGISVLSFESGRACDFVGSDTMWPFLFFFLNFGCAGFVVVATHGLFIAVLRFL